MQLSTFSNLPQRLHWVPLLALATVLAAVLPVHAQYKVIGADGKVSYSDRPPPTGAPGKVSTLGAPTAPVGGGDPSFPLELRQAVGRYPVTLYVISTNCAPCTAARQLLRDRGIPHQEKQVKTPEDSEALERLSGGREAPTLTIGAQTLHGLAPSVWQSYLDAAGYPRDSRLPANYIYPLATPITEGREARVVTEKPAPRAAASAPPAASSPSADNTPKIKF
jgi:glutaredoxin